MAQIEKADFTPTAPNFKQLVLMNFQGLTNFPYIEEDFDALTNYGLLSKIVEYLNQVISNNNEQNDLMTALYNAFDSLQTYVNNYFGTLDVQEEINKKLDEMAQSGELGTIIEKYVLPIINQQNIRIGNIESQVQSLASGSPIPVSSIEQMTNTSKVYVLTTTGEWYYYNGSSWISGGTYQSTGIGDNEVVFSNLSNKLTDDLYGYSTDASALGLRSQNYNASSINYTSHIFLKKGTTITVSEDFVTKYHWNLRRIRNHIGDYIQLFPETTETSYTVTEDFYGVFSWRPLDNDWGTEAYDVNQWHYLTNDDITSIKYYYPIKNGFLLDDINSYLLKNNVCLGNYAGGHPRLTTTRGGILRPIKSKYPIKFSVRNGYDYGVIQWTSNQDDATIISDTGWITEDFMLPADTYFTFSFRDHNNAGIQFISYFDEIVQLTSYANFGYINDYIDNRIDRIGEYNYSGIDLNMQIKHGYTNETLLTTSLITTSSQGFDIYDGKIVQLYNGGTLQVLDISTGETLASKWGLGFNHGDTCQFSNKKYDSNDLFPLLYVVSDTYPAVVHVIRIADLNTITNIKQYELGTDAGYYSGQCFDFEKNLIYSFGYKNQDFQTSANNNKTIIRIYDMNQETLISGTRYSLAVLDTFEEDFIYCIQGQKFFNGLCYLISSYNPSVQKTIIYVYDISKRKIVARFDNMPPIISNNETEDLAFIKNSDESKYDMIVGTRAVYEKITFM